MIFLKENEYNKEKNIKMIKIKDILLLINNIKNRIIKQRKKIHSKKKHKKIKTNYFLFSLKATFEETLLKISSL